MKKFVKATQLSREEMRKVMGGGDIKINCSQLGLITCSCEGQTFCSTADACLTLCAPLPVLVS